MKRLFVPMFLVLAVAAFAFTSSASAAEGKAMTPQQEKMANCAHENKGKKGEEYKHAMSECLKGTKSTNEVTSHSMSGGGENVQYRETKPKSNVKFEYGAQPKGESTDDTNTANAQREKIKTCNAQAKGKKLKGKARKDFLSECLKG